MSKLKLICGCIVITFALSLAQLHANKTEEVLNKEEILKDFSKLPDCDGSKIAEELCKQNCTGDGLLTKGSCSEKDM